MEKIYKRIFKEILTFKLKFFKWFYNKKTNKETKNLMDYKEILKQVKNVEKTSSYQKTLNLKQFKTKIFRNFQKTFKQISKQLKNKKFYAL